MQIFGLILLFLYVVLIIKFRFGWNKIKKQKHTVFTPSVSVVIAMRNEEKEVERLLKNLSEQIYPIEKFNIILVNDHSTDNTLNLLIKSDLNNLKIIDLIDGEHGKKDAIKKAVSIADSEIILASDADCSFTPYWTQTMVNYFVDEKVKFVSGPVAYYKENGVFKNMQALEFISLIASGAGAIGAGNAIFCNGANMAYRRNIFLEVNSFDLDNMASGDDVFLLHSVKSKYPDAIAFVKNKHAIVTTYSMNTFRAFINQRKRWVAKSSSYKDFTTIYTSYIVLLVNLLIVSLFVMSLLDMKLIKLFLLLYFVKFFSDIILLYPSFKFFKRKDLIKWVFPFELFYSFYIVLISVLSFTNKFEWKGRMHNK